MTTEEKIDLIETKVQELVKQQLAQYQLEDDHLYLFFMTSSDIKDVKVIGGVNMQIGVVSDAYRDIAMYCLEKAHGKN